MPPDELILTEVETLGITVIVMLLLDTLTLEIHGSELFKTQLTTSPFCNELLVNIELFEPTSNPFTFH